MTIDTLKFARRLEAAGIATKAAEETAEAIAEAFESVVVTKSDFVHLESRIDAVQRHLEGRIDALEQQVEGRMDALQSHFEGRMDALQSHFEGRIAALEQQVEGRIVALQSRVDGQINTLRWMLGFLLAIASAIFVKLFI